jgi:tripartite-type tricarboxylate transporter receptor subunit TctC
MSARPFAPRRRSRALVPKPAHVDCADFTASWAAQRASISLHWRRLCVLAVAVCTAAMQTTLSAHAQGFPNRPVRIVVGQSAGSTADNVARMIARALSDYWHQPVNVEDKAGAGGTIAAEYVAKAPADGYTLLLGGQSNLVVAAILGATLRYDPSANFFHVGRVVHTPFFFVVNAKVPARTVSELIAYGKAHPGRLTYISFGDGTISRIAFESLKKIAGVDMVEVPYRSSAPALGDLLGGRVDIGLFDLANVQQHVDAGTLHLLAATGAKRALSAPDLPTVAEQGVAGFAIDPWYGLLAPDGMPPEAASLLVAALDHVRREPKFQRQILALGYEPINDTPAQFAALIASEIQKYSGVITQAGIDDSSRRKTK